MRGDPRQPVDPVVFFTEGVQQAFYEIIPTVLGSCQGRRVGSSLSSTASNGGLSERKEGERHEKNDPCYPDEQGKGLPTIGATMKNQPPMTSLTASPMALEIFPSNPS